MAIGTRSGPGRLDVHRDPAPLSLPEARDAEQCARVTWPSRIASQMSIGWSAARGLEPKQMPSGTTICETSEMYERTLGVARALQPARVA